MNSKEQVLNAAEAAVTYANNTHATNSFPPWTTVAEHTGNLNVAINSYKPDLDPKTLRKFESSLVKLQNLDSRHFFKKNTVRKPKTITILERSA